MVDPKGEIFHGFHAQSQNPSSASESTSTLHQMSADEAKKWHAYFEARVNAYHGDDPLSEWLTHIHWTESVYPEDKRTDSVLYSLLRTCCQLFYHEGKESKKYYDDDRFVALWIKMATFINPPVPTYQFMHDRGIGLRSVELYSDWAKALLATNSVSQAEKILNLGISKCAEMPGKIAKLRSLHSSLFHQSLMSKTSHMSETISSSVSPEVHHSSDKTYFRDNRSDEKIPNKTTCFAETPSPEFERKDISCPGKSVIDEASLRSSMDLNSTRGNTRVFASSKRPRDSLFIKKYDNLPRGDSQTPLQSELFNPESVLGKDCPMLITQTTSTSTVAVFEAVPPQNVTADQIDQSEWDNLEYQDPTKPKLPCGGCPLEPPAGHVFFWDSSRFSCNEKEVSFEEDLALRFRQRIAAERIAQKQKWTDRETELKSDIRVAQQSLLSAEEKIRVLEDQQGALCRQLRSMEIKVEEEHCTAEAKLRAADEKLSTAEGNFQLLIANLRAAEDTLQNADLTVRFYQEIFRDVASSLGMLSNDLRHDVEPFEAVAVFAQNTQAKLDLLARQHRGKIQDGMLDMVHCVVVELARISQEHQRKTKPMAPKTTNENASDMMEIDSMQKESGTRSSHALSGSDQSNPCIKAMWNQTIGTTIREQKSQLEASKPQLNFFEGTMSLITPAAPESVSVVDGGNGPVRQSLAPRKSCKPLQTSAIEDVENMPVFRQPSQPANFQVFLDQSMASYIPHVEPSYFNEPEKENESDSENTPPVEMVQVAQPFRCMEVLHDSIVHPGTRPELLSEKDFVEVADSDTDSEGKDDDAPIVAGGGSDAAPVSPLHPEFVSGYFAPTSIIHKSLAPLGSDMLDEFNATFGRKSIGGTDQTLPFIISQSDFFWNIDTNKHMASTPLLLGQTEATTQRTRFQPRPSYQPPGGVQLSPITEGSREKSSTTSSSGVSTWLKSKKSIGTYSPVKEHDEAICVNPYADELLASFKDRFQDQFKEDSGIKCLSDASSPEIIVGKTQIRMQNQRYIIKELLGKGTFSEVYLARSQNDSSLTSAVKIQPKNGWWNHYIQSEAVRRVQTLPDADLFTPYLLPVIEFHEFKDGSSYTFMPSYEDGNMMKLVTAYQRSSEKTIPEAMALKFAVDVIRAVEALHLVNLIHGDINADHFLLYHPGKFIAAKTPAELLALPGVILTGFNCGIDLTLFDGPVTFTGSKRGKSTICNEILSTSPWTFQRDLIGILDVLYLLLFGEPLRVCRENDAWRPVRAFRQNWSGIWLSTFTKLLNVSSCDSLPDITLLRKEFEEAALVRLQASDVANLCRKNRVTFYMGRKSSYVSR